MRWLVPLLVIAICGGASDRALGIDCLTRWCRDAYCGDLKWSCLPEGGCCDDYCRKPLPCVKPLCDSGSCDDYCPKPLPCVKPLCYCGCCDDYCRKPLPQLNCHFCCGYPDYYRCGPPDRPFCCVPRKQPCGHPVDYQRGPSDQPHCCLPAPHGRATSGPKTSVARRRSPRAASRSPRAVRGSPDPAHGLTGGLQESRAVVGMGRPSVGAYDEVRRSAPSAT